MAVTSEAHLEHLAPTSWLLFGAAQPTFLILLISTLSWLFHCWQWPC